MSEEFKELKKKLLSTKKNGYDRVKNEELNSILNAEIDAEYVEQVARDLGYGTVGELV